MTTASWVTSQSARMLHAIADELWPSTPGVGDGDNLDLAAAAPSPARATVGSSSAGDRRTGRCRSRSARNKRDRDVGVESSPAGSEPKARGRPFCDAGGSHRRAGSRRFVLNVGASRFRRVRPRWVKQSRTGRWPAPRRRPAEAIAIVSHEPQDSSARRLLCRGFLGGDQSGAHAFPEPGQRGRP